MNFFKRAIKYSARQKLRSLLLFLTFTLLSTTILIALSSEKAVQQGTKQIKETVGASVRMEIDMNNQNNFGPAEDLGNGASGYTYNGDRITEKIINSIAELPNVVSYNAKIEDVVCGSSALVASSQRRIFGSDANALAIATLCFCPPDNCLG